VVELGRTLGNLDIQKLEILDFTKKSHKDRVKVDSEETLWSNRSLLSNEKELVELLFGAFLNTLLPLLDLKIFKLS